MIHVSGLSKTFRVRRRQAGLGSAVRSFFSPTYELIHALQDVSFDIGNGEMIGYIGPNGAGKSTTIKILSGILHPDKGEVTINGLVPWRDRVEHVRRIGVVFGQRSQLWWDVPVADSFDLLKDIYRTDEAVFRRNLDELTAALDLSTILQQPTRTLSLGQRMRCELAASLLHSPSILFLDEPTIGLDARNKLAVREFIRGQNQRHGTTVLLTTHDMQDIEALTERILLIGKGKLLLDGNIQALKKNLSDLRRLTVFHEGSMPALPPGIEIAERRPGQTRLLIRTGQIGISDAISQLARLVDVQDLTVEGVSAEELILSLYKEYTL